MSLSAADIDLINAKVGYYNPVDAHAQFFPMHADQLKALMDACRNEGRETADAELSAAWNELQCCDDVGLDGPIETVIGRLRDARDHWRTSALAAEARVKVLEHQLRQVLPFAQDVRLVALDSLFREAAATEAASLLQGEGSK